MPPVCYSNRSGSYPVFITVCAKNSCGIFRVRTQRDKDEYAA